MPQLDESRLAQIYEADGFGVGGTARAKVIRELVDEIRELRRQLGEHGLTRTPSARPGG